MCWYVWKGLSPALMLPPVLGTSPNPRYANDRNVRLFYNDFNGNNQFYETILQSETLVAWRSVPEVDRFLMMRAVLMADKAGDRRHAFAHPRIPRHFALSLIRQDQNMSEDEKLVAMDIIYRVLTDVAPAR